MSLARQRLKAMRGWCDTGPANIETTTRSKSTSFAIWRNHPSNTFALPSRESPLPERVEHLRIVRMADSQCITERPVAEVHCDESDAAANRAMRESSCINWIDRAPQVHTKTACPVGQGAEDHAACHLVGSLALAMERIIIAPLPASTTSMHGRRNNATMQAADGI